MIPLTLGESLDWEEVSEHCAAHRHLRKTRTFCHKHPWSWTHQHPCMALLPYRSSYNQDLRRWEPQEWSHLIVRATLELSHCHRHQSRWITSCLQWLQSAEWDYNQGCTLALIYWQIVPTILWSEILYDGGSEIWILANLTYSWSKAQDNIFYKEGTLSLEGPTIRPNQCARWLPAPDEHSPCKVPWHLCCCLPWQCYDLFIDIGGTCRPCQAGSWCSQWSQHDL